jgi:hypothetical protein
MFLVAGWWWRMVLGTQGNHDQGITRAGDLLCDGLGGCWLIVKDVYCFNTRFTGDLRFCQYTTLTHTYNEQMLLWPPCHFFRSGVVRSVTASPARFCHGQLKTMYQLICLDKVIHNWGLSHLWMGEVATIIDHRANGTHPQMASVINRSWNTSSSRYLLGELTYPRGGPSCSCGRLTLNPYQGALRRDSSDPNIKFVGKNAMISFPHISPMVSQFLLFHMLNQNKCWLVVCFVHRSGVERCHRSLSGSRRRSRGMFLPLHIRAWFQKYHQHQEGQGDWAWLGRGNMWWNLPLFIGKPVDQILGPAIYIYIYIYMFLYVCIYIYISISIYVYYIYNNHSDRIWTTQKVPSLNWPYLWHFHGLFQDDYTCSIMFPFGLPKSRGRCWDFRPRLRERLEVHSVRHIPNGFAFLWVFVIFCHEWYKHLY